MKKVLAGLVVSASVLGIGLSGGAAFAAPNNNVDTDVGVGFTGSNEPNPNEPEDSLFLKFTPFSFDFGKANKTDDRKVKEDTGSSKYVVIRDGRKLDGTQNWELSATMSQLTSGSTMLTGATIEFDAEIREYVGVNNAVPEAAGSITSGPGETKAALETPKRVTLSPNGGDTLLLSDKGTDHFLGSTTYKMDDIELNVPDTVSAGKQYTGKITWNLNDTI